MSCARSLVKPICLGAMAATLSFFSPTASATKIFEQYCPYNRFLYDAEVDFGQGHHSGGRPEHNGNVIWSLHNKNGVLAVSARVKGVLYLDKLDSGCGRMTVQVLDRDDEALAVFDSEDPKVKSVDVCGLGGDANNLGNQTTVDFESQPHERVARIKFNFFQGNMSGVVGVESFPVNLTHKKTTTMKVFSSTQTLPVSIENGEADFGGDEHEGGRPSNGKVRLSLDLNGTMTARVEGFLYWDAWIGDGTVRVAVNWLDRNGNLLRSRAVRLDGKGGPATAQWNHKNVIKEWSNSRLYALRLRVGRVRPDGTPADNTIAKDFFLRCPTLSVL